MGRPAATSNPNELIKMAIANLDEQIQELTEKRNQLAKVVAIQDIVPGVRRRGRPPGSTKAAKEEAVDAPEEIAVEAAEEEEVEAPKKAKRKVSATTRQKLKEAAQARWAKKREEEELQAA